MLGSPGYMSPEQIHDAREADVRTDVWALGVILYRMLAGREAFEGPTPASLMVQVLEYDPTPLEAVRQDIPIELAKAVHRCLEKDRRERFSSVLDLADALQPFASAEGKQSVERIGRTTRSAVTPAPLSRPNDETPAYARRDSRKSPAKGATLAEGATGRFRAQDASAKERYAALARATPDAPLDTGTPTQGTNALSRSIEDRRSIERLRRLAPVALIGSLAVVAFLLLSFGLGRRAHGPSAAAIARGSASAPPLPPPGAVVRADLAPFAPLAAPATSTDSPAAPLASAAPRAPRVPDCALGSPPRERHHPRRRRGRPPRAGEGEGGCGGVPEHRYVPVVSRDDRWKARRRHAADRRRAEARDAHPPLREPRDGDEADADADARARRAREPALHLRVTRVTRAPLTGATPTGSDRP